MIQHSRVREVARRLLEKTNAGLANWVAHPDDKHSQDCLLRLDKAAVELTYHDGTAEAPRIQLDLCRVDPQNFVPTPVATLIAYDDSEELNPQETDPQDLADSALLSELYRAATRYVYKWDEVIEAIESALNSGGKVGVEATSSARKPQLSSRF